MRRPLDLAPAPGSPHSARSRLTPFSLSRRCRVEPMTPRKLLLRIERGRWKPLVESAGTGNTDPRVGPGPGLPGSRASL